MLRTACILTGDNYALVSTDTPASKKKIVALALAMMVPVLIWVLNGFLLAYQVLQSSLTAAVITGLALGLIVFVIEKLIIMANGNSSLKRIRIAIGILVATLGSIALDEVVFREDIDLQMGELKAEAITKAKGKEDNSFRKQYDYAGLEQQIREAQGHFDRAEAKVIKEADGSSGTGKKGVGDITRLKDKKAGERKESLQQLQAQKAGLDKQKEAAINMAGATARDSFREHALLNRIKALFQLVFDDVYMGVIYLLFTLLLFFFEFLVVILKGTWSKTNYERKLEMIEQIGQKRMAFLQGEHSPLTDLGDYLQQLDPARTGLATKASLFN
ncbi:MAG: DUF4407 domain-containing protein [Ferruginibacter sp.]